MEEARTIDQALDAETLRTLVQKCWYSHDARWFAGVAQEFGLDAANRLNRRVLRDLSRVEMRRLIKALGVERAAGLDEMLRMIELGRQAFIAPSLMEFDVTRLDDTSYAIAFNRCFVHENIVRAGIADAYECAVFERVAGWHDALDLPLARELPAEPCALAQGRKCYRMLTVRPRP